MNKSSLLWVIALLLVAQLAWMKTVLSHGDVQPQAVDTEGLSPLPEEIALENPYRIMGGEQYELARKIGSSAYNSCLLYTSPSPRDRQKSRMPSSA